jgi:Fic family protein
MNNLFDYLRLEDDPIIIKSCVFHYEMECIHPFQDGNGRMGRIWQTRILMDENPIFEYLPIEAAIKKNQPGYYQALADADTQGKSTLFIDFMLRRILESLDEVLCSAGSRVVDYQTRVEFALSQLDGWFDRKKYLEVCKSVSTATASRDLKRMIQDGIVEISGSGRMTRYRKNLPSSST